MSDTYEGVTIRKLPPDTAYTFQWTTTSKMRNKAFCRWQLVMKRKKRTTKVVAPVPEDRLNSV